MYKKNQPKHNPRNREPEGRASRAGSQRRPPAGSRRQCPTAGVAVAAAGSGPGPPAPPPPPAPPLPPAPAPPVAAAPAPQSQSQRWPPPRPVPPRPPSVGCPPRSCSQNDRRRGSCCSHPAPTGVETSKKGKVSHRRVCGKSPVHVHERTSRPRPRWQPAHN